MSDSANQSQPSNTTPKTPPSPPKGPDAVQFKSKDIGVETAKPQDIFAKQRKEAEKQKQAEKKTRKILIIVFSILGGLIVIGLLIWLIVWLINSHNAANDLTPGSDNATTIQEEAEEIYAGSNNLDDVTNYFNDRVNNAESDGEKADLTIIEMSVYNDKDAPQKVVDAAERVDASYMNDEQRGRFYGMLVNAYTNLGDEEKAYYYIDLLEQEGLLETEGVEG